MEIAVITQDLAPVRTTGVEELTERFIGSQDVKESSRSLYRRTLRQYFSWIDRKGYNLQEIARPQIIEYKEDLLAQGLSSLTVGSYITTVRLFYEWAEANKFYPNVARGVRSPKRKQAFKKLALTMDQSVDILEYTDTLNNLRDRALILLDYYTGLRTIEISRARVEDITYKGGQRVLMVQGKGRDERDNFVLLEDEAYQPIKEYLATRRRILPSEPLFTSTSNNSRGDTLTTRTISKIIKEALKAIGLDNRSYTAHSLRHTTAVTILRGGGSLEQAQFTLRHANISTTQIYTHTLDEERRMSASGESIVARMMREAIQRRKIEAVPVPDEHYLDTVPVPEEYYYEYEVQ